MVSAEHRDPQALYMDDPLRLEFDARVVERRDLADGRSGVILERTYFSPTGGGQEHDTGRLGDARVVDIFKDEASGAVVHVLEGSLSEDISPVRAIIDGERRLRNMQQHSAQHLLSQCWLQLYEIESISANINAYTPSTLDVQASGLERDALEAVEALANRVIQEDREIKSYWIDSSQAGSLPLRMPPAVSGPIRVVEIEDYDYTACGGTHCTRTGMIGMLKIVKREHLKDKTRLYFVAGVQALEHFQAEHNLVSDLAAGLSVHPEELVAAVQRQGEDLKAAQRDLEAARRQLIVFEARQLAAQAQPLCDHRVILATFEDRPANELRWLAEELRNEAGLAAALAAYSAGKFSLVVVCGPDTGLSARKLLQDLLAPLGGRGGGDDSLAQGGGTAMWEQFQAWNEGAAGILMRLIDGR